MALRYFIENVLGAEQQLYQREGLPWTGLTLPDSEPVVNCIAQVRASKAQPSEAL